MKPVRKYDMQYHISSPCRPNAKRTEGSIIELKKIWYHIILNNKVLEILWDYGLVWIIKTGNLSVSSSRYGSERIPLEYVTREMPDISEYLDCTFYDRGTYRANAGLGELYIVRWLGTCSSPRRTSFLHALSFECTSKLCGTFLNQFSDYFHIKKRKLHNLVIELCSTLICFHK